MGVITDIVPTKRCKNRFSIFVDDAFFVALDAELVVKYGYIIGMDVDEDKLKATTIEDEKIKAMDKAMNLLQFRARTQNELIKALKDKGFLEDSIDYVLKRLTELKYIDDDYFANEYANELIERGYGEMAIKNKLYEKGIENQLISEILASIDEDVYIEKAVQQCEMMLSKNSNIEDKYKLKKKVCDYLNRHGYTYDISNKAYNMVQTHEEDFF